MRNRIGKYSRLKNIIVGFVIVSVLGGCSDSNTSETTTEPEMNPSIIIEKNPSIEVNEAEIDIDEYTDLISGGWWSTDFYPSGPINEVPDYIDISDKVIEVYDYDADNECYLLSGIYDINNIGRTENGYYIETGPELDKRTYEIDRNNPLLLNAYLKPRSEVSEEEYRSSYTGVDSLNSVKSYDKLDLTKIERRSNGDITAKGNTQITPELIVNVNDYECKWEQYAGHKYADTTGAESLILDKDHNLWYFGTESQKPVIIMKNVRLFSMEDDSDTLGVTVPVAVILTLDGDLYACGSVVYDTIKDVMPDSREITGDYISFLSPVLINKNVVDCIVKFREIDYYTENNELYRSKYNYQLFDVEIDNPTDTSSVDELSDYFIEHINSNYVLSETVQMGSARFFYISVLKDGSVWTCFLPETDEDRVYAKGYGEVMGDGSDRLVEAEPICIFPAGTCF